MEIGNHTIDENVWQRCASDFLGVPQELSSCDSCDMRNKCQNSSCRARPTRFQRFNLRFQSFNLLQPVSSPKVLRFSTRLQAFQLPTNISENRVGRAVCLHSDDNRFPGLLPRPQFSKSRTEVFHCRQDSAVVKVGCACCRKFRARGLAGIISKAVIGIRRIQ